MQEHRAKNVLKGDETRRRLIATGQRLFSAQGFAATGTEEIVAAAGVTRGALYFHFADKTALFAAVFEAVAREVAAAIATASDDAPSPREALRRGAAAYVNAAADPANRRIYLIDGPAVLGGVQWFEMENRHSRPLLMEGLTALGVPDPMAMAHLLSGAMVEAAHWQALQPDAAPRLAAALERLLTALA